MIITEKKPNKSLTKKALLRVEGLKTYFPVKGGIFNKTIGHVKAVNDISFSVKRGETFGIVGESGSGKSTLGQTILRLQKPTSGKIIFQEEDITNLSDLQVRKYRRHMQMVFQDPYASLNPRMKVGSLIEEPMIVHGLGSSDERKKKVAQLIETVGLPSDAILKYPHEFSGGQRQRIGIARALSINPQLIIADEPVSALDVSIQSQVLNLLRDLQEEFDLTYLFIAHDLSVVKHISDRIGVMYLGKIVELSSKTSLYENPLHPYTQSLLSAIPVPDPHAKRERIILQGDIPNPTNPPSGCVFRTRCPSAYERCRQESPTLTHHGEGHYVACHLYTDLKNEVEK
ncbi:ABC transporter ATP-binding protein [Pseudogracilibacillus auburnensis]|uniref:Peptide/nickel transport system ATP-binding protein/oligopeptide transport system ATP-binding protein n=1 Tax=Pseudogracilibacillus auburnensis TaxID=1494959 RepID=A0A2V3WB70_9BACI|nr:dipeptide ABC transporter ATP-binding protein [Pseudogracilibacillus auburnensis]PXW85989.1 peptide/nickel transport system ATP-binding protein/oligopeptide transport system ATP-binding protein [Pseudogracilibacillus auburnensis]